jgi:hypothetical protein
LLVDAEHLDAEFIGVCRSTAATSATSTAPRAAVTAAARRNRPGVFIRATIF